MAPGEQSTFEGHCLCDAISITFTGAPKSVIFCYCRTCSRAAGAPYQHILVIPLSTLEIADPDGVLKEYLISDTMSGIPKPRGFCGRCGTSLYTTPASEGESGEPMRFIRAGLFDGGFEIFKPTRELFTKRRPAYMTAFEGAQQYETM